MDEAERRRKKFIRSHHPDRGGDPGAFIAGLRRFDDEQRSPFPEPPAKVVAVRRRTLARRLAATAKRWLASRETRRVR
jgi:hypothetical protein